MEQLNSENNVAVLLNLLQQPIQQPMLEQAPVSTQKENSIKPTESFQVKVSAREVIATLNLLKHIDGDDGFGSLSQEEIFAFITKIDRESASIEKEEKYLKTSCMTEKQIESFQKNLDGFKADLEFYKKKLYEALNNRISA